MTTKETDKVATSAARRGRGRPQARPDEETLAVILDAARSEITSAGYAATNMESVARRAGVSTKTLYRLVPNKATLFETMITDRVDRVASVVRLRASDDKPLEAALCEALIVCGELILDGEVIELQRMILSESAKFPEIAESFYHNAIRRTERALARWLDDKRERGLIDISNAEASAGMLLGMLAFQPQRAMLFARVAAPSREELEHRAQAAVHVFLKGCGR